MNEYFCELGIKNPGYHYCLVSPTWRPHHSRSSAPQNWAYIWNHPPQAFHYQHTFYKTLSLFQLQGHNPQGKNHLTTEKLTCIKSGNIHGTSTVRLCSGFWGDWCIDTVYYKNLLTEVAVSCLFVDQAHRDIPTSRSAHGCVARTLTLQGFPGQPRTLFYHCDRIVG